MKEERLELVGVDRAESGEVEVGLEDLRFHTLRRSRCSDSNDEDEEEGACESCVDVLQRTWRCRDESRLLDGVKARLATRSASDGERAILWW